MRLFRYLLRLFGRGKSAARRAPETAFGGGATPSRLAVAALATATVVGLAFVPSLTEGGSDGALALAGATSTPVALAIATTPVPSPAGSDPSPTPEGEPGSTPSPNTTVAGGAEDAPAGQQPGPEGAPSGDDLASPPTSTPEPTLAPAPAPNPAPTATPTPLPRPSLDLVSVSATLQCQSTVIVQIANRGPDGMAETAMVTVEVTLKRRAIYTASATKTIQLAATAGTDFTVVLPVSAIDGCRYGPGGDEEVTVVVDSTNVLVESNEGNNSADYILG